MKEKSFSQGGLYEQGTGEDVEEIEFLSRLALDECTYYAAHMLNPVQLTGILPKDKDRMLGELWDDRDYYSKRGMLSYQMNF